MPERQRFTATLRQVKGSAAPTLGLIAKEAAGMRGAERNLLEGIWLLTPLRHVAILASRSRR